MALTPWQQTIFDKSRAEGLGTVQEMLEQGGASASFDNYATVLGMLNRANLAAPLTRAEVYATQASTATAAGGKRELTQWEKDFVANKAVPNGWGAADIANHFQQAGHPVTSNQIQAILKGAGITLSGVPNKAPGVTAPPATKAPDFPGGLPGAQPTGGMYGANAAQIPQTPFLRNVFDQMRRRSAPNWNGKTDTILTSGRGVLTNPMLARKTLLGQ